MSQRDRPTKDVRQMYSDLCKHVLADNQAEAKRVAVALLLRKRHADQPRAGLGFRPTKSS